MTYLDAGWSCGGVAYSYCTAVKWLSEPKKHRQDCLMSRARLLAVFWECATPPHVHPMSRYVTAHDQFYQAFSCLVLQATNAGGERAGVRGYDIDTHKTPDFSSNSIWQAFHLNWWSVPCSWLFHNWIKCHDWSRTLSMHEALWDDSGQECTPQCT